MLKSMIHKIAWRLEKLVDRVFVSKNTARVIEAYNGYATQTHLIVRGRVLTSLRRNKPLPHQSRFTNFRQMLSLFLTDEVADVALSANGVKAVSDEEGYFQITLPRGDESGWVDVPVRIEGRDHSTMCSVLVAEKNARLMVISDVDDTMMETGAYSLMRNLWVSFTGNVNSRRVFPDSVALIKELSQNGLNPVYFVSSSPWNLYTFLSTIFARADIPRAPMFLRDLGLSETQFITNGHGSHKGASIDILLAANPDLPVILIGDTGQKDAHIYRDAIARHPGRIKTVILREPGGGADPDDLASIKDIQAMGVECLHGPDFGPFVKNS